MKKKIETPIIIKLRKEHDDYVYVSDNLNTENKIKIPLDFNKKIKREDKHMIQLDEIGGQVNVSLDEEGEKEANYIKMQVEKNENIPVLIPTCSQWFDIDKIHEIEMNSLPEFFCGKYPSKTPSNYKEYRNFIVGLYRENPSCYLSATACRRYLVGDVCSLMRLHAFLENWGLINFNVDPQYRPIHPYATKSITHKTPILIDATVLTLKEEDNIGYKLGENKVILTKNKIEQRSLHPINNIPEHLFRSVFSKTNLSQLNHINFLSKNYRFECDNCSNLCGMFFYIEKKNNEDFLKTNLIICENCLKEGIDIKKYAKDDFTFTSIFYLINSSECKFFT